LQLIIAMQSKLSKNDQIFGEKHYSSTQKRQMSVTSPNSESISKKRKNTESITFRLESEILNSLRQEAKRKDIRLNTLVSQIAKLHTSWHSMAAQAGFISVRKALVSKLLESQDDEQIKSLARYVAKSTNRDFILMLRRKCNIHSALDIIETWIRITGYSYTHNTEDLNYSKRMHMFVVHHEMGRRWSLYLAELYKNLFEEFDVRTSQFEMTDSTLVFDVVVSIEEDEEGNSYTNMEGTIKDRVDR
jgi:hypothetical protein